MNKIFFFALIFFSALTNAQLFLKPSIGVTNIPHNSDTICTIPIYTGSFYTTGLNAGDTAYDFKLYSLNGDSIILSDLLSTGKPLLIVNGNYTCPVFRNKVAMINQVAATYSGQINVIIIYTVEAHPTTISPYFGYINTNNQNISAGILFAQPTTYLERKNIVDTMLNSMTISVPVYIDAPCNPWWATYGPAPNNSYLIKPNGIIFSKHGWFDKNPVDYILCDIDSLLFGTPCIIGGNAGNFSIQQLDTLVTGVAGNILYGFTEIINNSNSTITVSAKKIQKNYSANWQTAFCADICYSPTDDSITFTIAPYDTMHLSIDFITNAIPDSGSIKIGFRNINDMSNQFSIVVKAKTFTANFIEDIENENHFNLYPNPATHSIFIVLSKLPLEETQMEVIDVLGKVILSQKVNVIKSVIPITTLQNGIYFIKVGHEVQCFIRQ